jgi:hypothetical protein
MQPRNLFIDVASRRFVDGIDSTLVASDYVAFNEDVESVALYFLEPTGDFSAPYRYTDYSSNTVKLAVGTTAPAALVTSWSAISTAVAITTSVSITGGLGTTAIQRVQITPPAVAGSYALKIPSRQVTVSSISASVFSAPFHGLFDGQSVTLTGFTTPSNFANGSDYFIRDRARDTFKIASTPGGTAITASVASGGGTAVTTDYITPPISAKANSLEIAAALSSATGSASAAFSVSGKPSDYLISYTGTMAGASVGTITSLASTLVGAVGLTANLSFNTNEIAALIAAGVRDVTLEVEVSDGTLRQTFQRGVSLGSDLITSSSAIPAPVGQPVSALNFDDGQGGVWALTVDANGVLTATKQ